MMLDIFVLCVPCMIVSEGILNYFVFKKIAYDCIFTCNYVLSDFGISYVFCDFLLVCVNQCMFV